MKYVRLTDKEKVDIIERYSVGLETMIDLAKEHGITRQGIYKLLKGAGVETSKELAGNIMVSCTVCGKEVSKHRMQVRNFLHQFCSKDCYFAWLKHGNGNPLIMHRNSARQARAIVSDLFALRPGNCVHHKDRNQYNNKLSNLMVFANSGDHVRHHRGFTVPVLWDGAAR